VDEPHVGYLDFDGKVARLHSARCSFDGRELDVEAEGAKCKLHLYGIPFPGAAGISGVAGRSYGPAEVAGDPIAEGGIETKTMWLSFERLEVRCRGYDPDAGLMTVALEADVCDSLSGRSGRVDCRVRCTVVKSVWEPADGPASQGAVFDDEP
jgi:hypothetical protein